MGLWIFLLFFVGLGGDYSSYYSSYYESSPKSSSYYDQPYSASSYPYSPQSLSLSSSITILPPSPSSSSSSPDDSATQSISSSSSSLPSQSLPSPSLPSLPSLPSSSLSSTPLTQPLMSSSSSPSSLINSFNCTFFFFLIFSTPFLLLSTTRLATTLSSSFNQFINFSYQLSFFSNRSLTFLSLFLNFRFPTNQLNFSSSSTAVLKFCQYCYCRSLLCILDFWIIYLQIQFLDLRRSGSSFFSVQSKPWKFKSPCTYQKLGSDYQLSQLMSWKCLILSTDTPRWVSLLDSGASASGYQRRANLLALLPLWRCEGSTLSRKILFYFLVDISRFLASFAFYIFLFLAICSLYAKLLNTDLLCAGFELFALVLGFSAVGLSSLGFFTFFAIVEQLYQQNTIQHNSIIKSLTIPSPSSPLSPKFPSSLIPAQPIYFPFSNATQFNNTFYFKQKMKAHSATHQHDKKSIFQFLPGPVKIKDGLFMGDEIAARDIEFIISNKVTHIINTVSKQIPNLWERFGIHYLSVNWTEKQQNIFDKKNNAVNTIFHFVEEAMQQGESCLIHSVNGKSRACAVLVAYMMKKYAWSLNKCLEFIASKKENLEIRNSYLVQMQELEQRMSQIYNLSSQWTVTKNEDQLLLRNTYANSKPMILEKSEEKSEKKNKKKVTWGEKPIVAQKTNPVIAKTATNFREANKVQTPVKSILKGDPGPEPNADDQKNQAGEDYDQFQQGEGGKARNQGSYINNINGNIVHVTVNNFITSDKKPEIQGKNAVNTRPFSSDQKDREKDKKIINQKKIMPYDTNALLSFKSPYDSKVVPTRPMSNTKATRTRDQREKDPKSATVTSMGYERPQSAKSRTAPFGSKLKDQLIVTNGVTNMYNLNKKRYPSNPREDLFRKR